jgi:hypothetical protein
MKRAFYASVAVTTVVWGITTYLRVRENTQEVGDFLEAQAKHSKGSTKKGKSGSSNGVDKSDESLAKKESSNAIVYGKMKTQGLGNTPRDQAAYLIKYVELVDCNGKKMFGNAITPKGRNLVMLAHYFADMEYPIHLTVQGPAWNRTKYEMYIDSAEEWIQPYASVGDEQIPLDVAVYEMPKNVPLSKDKTHLFAEVDTMRARNLDGIQMLSWTPDNGFETYGTGNSIYVDKYMPNLNTEQQYKLPGIYMKAKTPKGSCGSIVFDTNNQNIPFLGIHQGRYPSGWTRSQFTPKEFWEVLYEDDVKIETEQEYEAREKFVQQSIFQEGVPPNFIPPENIVIEGSVSKEFKYNLPETTRLVPSIFLDTEGISPWGKPEKEPAVLTQKDPRGNGTSPCKNAMGEVSIPISPSKSSMDKAGDWLLLDFKRAATHVRPNLYKLNDKQIISGVDGSMNPDPLNLLTSPGFPLNKLKPPGVKGRTHLIDRVTNSYKDHNFKRQLKMREELAKAHTVPYDSVFAWVSKDEKQKLSKVENNMTRFFMVAPLDHLILCKKYFGAFVQWFETAKEFLFHAIGINPFSPDWNCMIKGLKRIGKKGFDGDYKRFDKAILSQLQWQGVKAINELYRLYDPTWTPEDDRIRETLIFEAIQTKSLAIDAIFYMRSGVPSGFYLTALMNSCINRMMVAMAYQDLFHDATYNDFIKDLAMKVLGDDIMTALSEEIQDKFTGEYYKQWLAKHNITFTSADKNSDVIDHKLVEDLEFLKCRTKVLTGGNYIAVPEKISIHAMLSYIRAEGSKDDQIEQMITCANDALRFVFWYGHAEFEKYRNYMKSVTDRESIPADYLTYNQILDWYKDSFGDDFDLGDFSTNKKIVNFAC